MKDEEIEKLVLTHQSSSICYCHTKGKADCKQHKALLELARRIASKVRDEVLDKAERAVSGVSIYSSNHIVRQEVFPEEVRVRAIDAVRALKSGSVEG